MRIERGLIVLLTGASGGLGTYLTRGFVERGTRLALAAYPGSGLEELCQQARQHGTQAIAYASDVRDPAQRRELVESVARELGPVDILVNAAGVEFTSPYDLLSEENILDVLRVNLEGAMILTRLLLPGMLQRRRGHIVNLSSLAGRANPALQEPYAATKAGLIGFTYSLRASYQGTGVSASAIVPGFVEAGIYAKLKEASGCSAPALLGTVPPEKVVQAVFRAIEGDRPEVIVNALPVRPLLAFCALAPVLGERALNLTGGHDFFRRVFEATKRNRR